MPKDYIWTRRADENEPSYEGFQTYLRLGAGRSIAKAAEKLGKSRQTLEPWSAKYNWVERARAYDVHLETAATDGFTHQLAEARDENLDLARKLRGHLSRRLDDFIERNQDPSVRWSQALNSLCKLDATAFAMKDDPKTSERLQSIERLVIELVGEDVA